MSIEFRWVLLSLDGRFLAGMGWGSFKLRWVLLRQWVYLMGTFKIRWALLARAHRHSFRGPFYVLMDVFSTPMDIFNASMDAF